MKARFLLLWLVLSGCAAHSASTEVQTESGYVRVDGDSLFYEARGKGRSLIFVHGGFVDRRMWDPQFDEFACCYRVIRYDLRGFGHSPAPKAPYSPVDDLRKVLDHFSIERAALVGLSMGGSVVIDFAVTHPSRIATLVLVATAPSGMPVTNEDMRPILELFETGQRDSPRAAVEKWLQHPMLAATMSNPVSAPAMRTLAEENAAFFALGFWPMKAIEPSALNRLMSIEAPVLVIEGELDTPLNRRGSQLLRSEIPNARHVRIRAGHMVSMEQPERFNVVVREFLRTARQPMSDEQNRE